MPRLASPWGGFGVAWRQGVELILNIRRRYDGKRRNPWDESECRHHYTRTRGKLRADAGLSRFRYHGAETTPPESSHWSSQRLFSLKRAKNSRWNLEAPKFRTSDKTDKLQTLEGDKKGSAGDKGSEFTRPHAGRLIHNLRLTRR
jgi:hypothetical protein